MTLITSSMDERDERKRTSGEADQPAKIRLDLWPPSLRARPPTPIAAKADPIPTHQRLGTDDRESLQNQWEPAIELDEKPASPFVS
jgi:hypothetical protein